ncbi:hypothetical protein DFH07DRAFT_764348 [Mycena maculata]|uniref:Uncharacterized protein n=1 Tax=Mycena maculata TaxID=230809 RepID=A0AAD7P1N0_9AGAR|nr:hypothetical protein DFH07DRAFT_764348 [Mycena maculata]
MSPMSSGAFQNDLQEWQWGEKCKKTAGPYFTGPTEPVPILLSRGNGWVAVPLCFWDSDKTQWQPPPLVPSTSFASGTALLGFPGCQIHPIRVVDIIDGSHRVLRPRGAAFPSFFHSDLFPWAESSGSALWDTAPVSSWLPAPTPQPDGLQWDPRTMQSTVLMALGQWRLELLPLVRVPEICFATATISLKTTVGHPAAWSQTYIQLTRLGHEWVEHYPDEFAKRYKDHQRYLEFLAQSRDRPNSTFNTCSESVRLRTQWCNFYTSHNRPSQGSGATEIQAAMSLRANGKEQPRMILNGSRISTSLSRGFTT